MNRCEFRSDEEFDFVLWLEEAKDHGLISGWAYEPRSFNLFDKQTYTETVQLKTKTKEVERHLHAEAHYTPDFAITLTKHGLVLLFDVFKASYLTIPIYVRAMNVPQIWIDVKGSFDPHQNDTKNFSMVRKVMYDKYGIWVAKVIPFFRKKNKAKESIAKGFFVDTFAPKSMRWIKNRRTPTLSSCGKGCRGVSEFMTGDSK